MHRQPARLLPDRHAGLFLRHLLVAQGPQGAWPTAQPACKSSTYICGSQCEKVSCLCAGDQILDDQLSFGGRHLWEPFLGLLVLILLYNFIGYLGLRFGKPKYLPLRLSAGVTESNKKTTAKH